MPRQLRIEYEGAIYHLMNRGDRREPIFRDDLDCERFIVTLGDACGKTGWQVHAFCLMGNHFHLVIETPHANLVAGMKWFLGTYTNRFNRRHQLTGHLFAGRYKSLLVEGGGNGYLRTVCDYVHLNPSRARLIGPEQPLRDYRWSSFGIYLRLPEERPDWLRVDRLLGEMGISQDSAPNRREFEALTESRRAAENSDDWRLLRRGWCYGNTEFRRELLSQVPPEAPARFPEPRRVSAQEKAEQVIAEELARRHWAESDLVTRRKGDPEKLRIARRLRRETTVTLKWVADRLHTGAWTYLANSLYATADNAPQRPTKPGQRNHRSQRATPAKPKQARTKPPASPSPTLSVSIPRPEPPPPPEPSAAPASGEPAEDVLPLHCL